MEDSIGLTRSSNESQVVELTAEIVAAYVAHNSLSQNDLPRLINEVHAALNGLGTPPAPAEQPAAPQLPAVSVKKSVLPDYIVCLEDGKKFKSLKRHLRTHYDLSPEEYRAKWKLPADYPMVAPNYSATRSNLAKQNGLGRKPVEVTVPTKRGRPRKVDA